MVGHWIQLLEIRIYAERWTFKGEGSVFDVGCPGFQPTVCEMTWKSRNSWTIGHGEFWNSCHRRWKLKLQKWLRLSSKRLYNGSLEEQQCIRVKHRNKRNEEDLWKQLRKGRRTISLMCVSWNPKEVYALIVREPSSEWVHRVLYLTSWE